MAADGTIKISTSLDNDATQKAMSKFAGIAKTGLKGVSVAVGAVSTALAGAGVYAIKTGIDFETAFAGVKKTVDATDAELTEFRQGIRDMAKEMPQSASSIAEVAEAAGQLGIKNDSILSFTRVMSDLGVATNMSATEAATSLARLANITQMPQENFDRLGSTIVALGNNLATTESEITEMGLRLAGAGKQVGMTEAEILGLAGAISSVGIEADAGGSAVSTVMAKMQLAVEKGGESLEQFADVAGMSAQDFQKAFKDDAAQALVSFVKGLGTMEDRGKSAIATLSDMEITEIRQRDALLRLSGAGDVLSESLGIAAQAWDENNALTKEAEQRYETLESRLQILKNNVADLGISFYDELRDPLKSTVDEGIADVERLSDAFSNGGLKSAVSAAGDIFADVAVEASQQAPKMVNASVDFMKAFAIGIYDNRGEIKDAAGDVAETMAQGLAELLPESVREPVQDAIKDIADSFENGGLNDAVETVSTTIGNFGELVGDVAKVALPPLTKAVDFAGEHLDVLAASATGVFTAFKGYKQVQSSTSAFNKARQAIATVTQVTRDLSAAGTKAELAELALGGALKTNEIIIGTLTGKISIVTAAQKLWNTAMSANPIGLVVTAVAALAAGIGALYLVADKQVEITAKLSDEQNDLRKGIDDTADKIKQMNASREESIKSATKEIDANATLWSELQNIVDVNGKVKDGYEARAGYITKQLSEALGIEISLQDGIIQGYKDQISAIGDLIETQRAQAALEAMEGDYQEAIRGKTEALQEYLSAQRESADVEERLAAAQQRLSDITEQARKEAELYGGATAATNEAQIAAQTEVDQLAANYKELSDAEAAAKNSYQSYQDIIAQYEGLSAAIVSGDTNQIKQALMDISADFVKFGEVSNGELQKAATDAASNMALLGQEIKNGTMDATDSAVTDFANMTAMSLGEMSKLPGGAAKHFEEIEPAAVASLVGLSGSLTSESKKALDGFLEGFNGLKPETQNMWAQAVYGALEGLEGFEELADPAKEGADVFLESLREALEVHSPSQAVEEIFENVWPGASDGLDSGKEELNEKGKGVIQSFLESLGGKELAAKAQEIGSKAMSFFGIGISSQSGNSYFSGKANADAANEGLGSADTKGTGTAQSAEYDSGLESADTYDTGKRKAEEGNSGLESVDASGTGSNFIQGFINGFGLADVWSAAWDIGKRALSALSSAIKEGSPSKLTRISGKFFTQGFELGIKDEEKAAVKSAKALAEDTISTFNENLILENLKSFDISDLMSQVYGALDERHAIVSDHIVLEIERQDAVRNTRSNETDKKYEELLDCVMSLSKLADRPILTSVVVNDREIVRATAKPMQEVIDSNQKFKRMLRGDKT